MANSIGDNPDYELPNMSYVPAALYFNSYGGLGIYVKHKGHGKHGTQVISASGLNTHLMCPDREVFMCGNLQKIDSAEVFGDWDEFYPISLFHDMPGVKAQRGPEIFMVNAHQDKGRESVRHDTRASPPLPNARQIMGDSGGFQLRIPGSFIDPASVTKYYNSNVDMGITLDFPLWDPNHHDNLMRSAAIQRRNNELILAELMPHVTLINVVHGMKLSYKMDFLDVVHRDEITALAVSNISFGDGVVAFCYNLKMLYDAIEERYPGHYKHFHILGMTESKLMVSLSRMVANGLFGDMRITFDSSTHLHSSNAKSYLTTNSGMQSIRRIPIGDDNNLFNSNQRLACNCPVCDAVGWMDALNLSSASGISFFLSMHNIYATDSHFKSVLWYTKYLDREDMLYLVGKMFGHKPTVRDEVQAAIRYVDDIKDLGVDEANEMWGFFIDYTNEEEEVSTEQSLFSNTTILDEELREYDDHRPAWEQDLERIEVYEGRILALNAGISNFDVAKGVTRKRNSRSKINGPKLKGESSHTAEVKEKTKNRKRDDMKQSEVKVMTSTKVRKATRYAKASLAPKKEAGEKTTMVRGKKVVKSERRKRL